MIKRALIDKVIAKYTDGLPNDFDMVNLFPNRDPVDDVEDAYDGDTEVMPKKTLRNRYMQQPLMLRPEYKGDFLEQLRLRKPGVRPENLIQADDQTNLKDFTDPEEMLKHQEEPYPRVVVDDFIEFNVPSPHRENETLKDYDDRGWEKEEAPEMSEDLIDRLRGVPKEQLPKTFKMPGKKPARVAMSFIRRLMGIDPSRVVASFLSRRARSAMTLEGLKESRINGEPLKADGVAPRPITDPNHPNLSDPAHGLWSFRTGKGGYVTSFEFIPEEGKEFVRDLNVKVNCSCPSWLWWGGLFNAFRNDYLYGPIHFHVKPPAVGQLVPPNTRDPERKFKACKHMIGCISGIEGNRLPYAREVAEEAGRKPTPGDIVRIEEGIKEDELRSQGMPTWLSPLKKNIENQEPIKGVLRRWDGMSLEERTSFIRDLESPAHLLYMGYKFPGKAARLVLDQLNLRKFSPGWRDRINRAKTVFKGYGDQVKNLINRNLQQTGGRMAADSDDIDEGDLKKAWTGMSETDRKKYMGSIDDPANVYAVFLMLPKQTLGYVLLRLKEMLKDSGTEKEAEEYLRHFI